MLDEADKDKNTYYLEENISTIEETEIINFTEFFEDETSDEYGSETIEIGFESGDGFVAAPSDLMKDIPDNIRIMFSEISGVYAE